MKLKLILIHLFILLFSTATIASEIGYIDMQRIFTELKSINNFKENFLEKEKEFKELLEKKNAEIEEAIKDEKKEEKIKEMIAKRDEVLLPKQEELANLEQAFQINLKFEISSTSEKIAEEFGLDIVVDKTVLYYGGFDITTLVLDRLNQ